MTSMDTNLLLENDRHGDDANEVQQKMAFKVKLHEGQDHNDDSLHE